VQWHGLEGGARGGAGLGRKLSLEEKRGCVWEGTRQSVGALEKGGGDGKSSSRRVVVMVWWGGRGGEGKEAARRRPHN